MFRYGEFEWPDGKKYKGCWDNGKQHGMGTFINQLGQIREGEWINGKRIGWKTDITELAL